ncbi:DNA-binding GntR family transcriptional regulator [Arthrobacter sp. GAS37]
MANELGLGRMPVREAIARLATDRFITVVPRRGAVVTPVGLDDVLDMFEAREAIGCGVAYTVAKRATKDDMVTLRGLVNQRTMRARGWTTSSTSPMTTRSMPFSCTWSATLCCRTPRIACSSMIFGSGECTGPPGLRTQSAMISHADLVWALEAHDSELAAQAMREHLAASAICCNPHSEPAAALCPIGS